MKNSASFSFWKIVFLKTIGNFLIIFSIFILLKTFSKPIFAEIKYQYDAFSQKNYVVIEETESKANNSSLPLQINLGTKQNTNINLLPNTEIIRPLDLNFSIVIPKIAANAVVVPNVDTANESSYLDALQKGVAHALGTDFPGSGRHIFLFAHSTDYFWRVGDYNAVFYLLYKLEKGDEINLYFSGKRHKYEVFNKMIIDPSQVQYLTRLTPNEELTLQTCWPPGTTLKRLLIFAKKPTQ